METKNLCDELFQSILVDGLTQTNLVKVDTLLEVLSSEKDFKSEDQESIFALIFLLESLSIDNILIKLELQTIKANFIKFKINKKEDIVEHEEPKKEECCPEPESFETKVEKKKQYDFFPDLFTVESGNRHRAKNKKLWSTNPKEHAFFTAIDENNSQWEFAVDSEGYLTEYRHLGDNGDVDEDIDYDEIYNELEDSILKFKDSENS